MRKAMKNLADSAAIDDASMEAINAGMWLRSFKGCEHYDDEQALQIVRTFDSLAEVMFEYSIQQMEKNKNENNKGSSTNCG